MEATRTALLTAGIEVGPVFHPGPDGPIEGLDPERRSYFSRATFRAAAPEDRHLCHLRPHDGQP
ncbi:hypothetical protein ACF1GT_35780 [Streptomyces sp. NPDC014636]|uniref:hypothetical protein n=1 Tax=Streptomyces sp. NPDC014636 TaxID=3364876 RepID=UPI0036FA08E6